MEPEPTPAEGAQADNSLILMDGKGNVTKTIEIKELTAREAMNADRLSMEMGLIGNVVRAFFAIVKIDSVPTAPAMNEGTFTALADRFTMREYDSLTDQYARKFILDKEQLDRLSKMQGLRS